MVLGAVAGNAVEKKIFDMDLYCIVCWKRIGEGEFYWGNLCCGDGGGEVVAHLAGITACARFLNLDFAKHPVSCGIGGTAKGEPECKGDIKERFRRSTYEITAEYGERDKPFGCRDMLIAKLGKAVIGGDKEVVTADTVAVAKRGAVCSNSNSQLAPLGLGPMW